MCIRDSSVTSIGSYAFSGTPLTSLTIPDSVELIGYSAFSNCSSITTLIIGNGLRVIQSGTFSNCSSLRNIEFGENINIIKNYAFAGCSSLMLLEFNNFLYQIDSRAFENCEQLRSITLGNYLRYLESDSFVGCNLLIEANFKGSPPVIDTGPFQNSPTTVFVDTNATGWLENFSFRPIFRKNLLTENNEGSISNPASTSAFINVYSSHNLENWTHIESMEIENAPSDLFIKTELTPPTE